MLTKDDLVKIRKIVREEVENESQAIKDELGADITMSRINIQNDIRGLKDRVKSLEIRLTKMHRELKDEIKLVANFLDRENVATNKRVKRVEDHLQIPPQQN